MFSFTVRLSRMVLGGLAALAQVATQVQAQSSMPLLPGGPNFGTHMSQLRAFNQALRSMPPSLLSSNASLLPTVGNSLVNNLVNNPYAALSAGSSGYGASLYNNPYSGYGGYWYDPYGGFLRGTADVINAQGKFAQDQQKGLLIREQIQSERIANRRTLVDEYLHEREKLPTLQDERERTQAQELRRSLTDPPITEIWSAKALNDLLAELQKQSAKGVMATYRGPKEPLDQDQLKLINVTSVNRGGNIGLLKNGGRLSWPLALTGPEFKEERERLSSLAQDLVKEVEFNSRVDAGSLRQMNEDLDRLQRQLSKNVGDLPPSQYIEAKRFLNNLADALKVMGQPDAASYINRKYAAKGKTVPDLVKYLTENGLQFAPAVSGEEAAYVALQRALAAYAQGLQYQDGDRR
jgi:hypothetical protein